MKRSEIVKILAGQGDLYGELQAWLNIVGGKIVEKYSFLDVLDSESFYPDRIEVSVCEAEFGNYERTQSFTIEELDMEPEEYVKLYKERKKLEEERRKKQADANARQVKKAWAESTERYDRSEYERLKKKYGDK